MADTLTLCYHAVSERWPAPLAVTPAAFEEQITLMLERGYEGVTFSRAVAGGGPRRALVVTFDDAFRSVGELALPILERLGVPATVFVATDYPGSGRPMAWDGLHTWDGGEWASELECMSWDELRGLAAHGWEVGAHTRSHPRLTSVDDATLAQELVGARAVCESQLGRPCRSLAYPYGDCDARVIAAADSAGYTAAAALDARLRGSLPLRWPRIGVYRKDDRRRFELKTSRAIRALRSSVAWEAVTGTRQTVAQVRGLAVDARA